MRQFYGAIGIINILREAQGGRVKLAELVEEYGGKVPRHTGGGEFGATIAGLINTGIIDLYTKRDSLTCDLLITSEIESIGDTNSQSLTRGYEIAAALIGHEQEIEIVLTDKLAKLQETLGLSITQLLDDKDPDMFRVKPVFGKPTGSPSSDVFVLMPFQVDLLPVYEDHIKTVCKKLKMSCKRADDLFGSNTIIQDVWELIANSRLLIADCTGRNPNVFYELGIAHTLGKKVILIARSEDDIPFDIRHIRYIKYDFTPRGMDDFENTLSKFIVDAIPRH